MFCNVAVAFSQQKSLPATEISGLIKIDGVLDEAIWLKATAAKDFITKSPVYGQPSTARVFVRILYDQEAVYIGAHIQDELKNVRKQFTARDQLSRTDVDYFGVFLDTYHDRQNAYQFIVTSRNVQNDARVSPQAEGDWGTYGDVSWDAVWESRVSFNKDGWNVEMKIPYFAIRFPKQTIQEWGLQFIHFSRKTNETSFWNPNNPNQNGFVNQFGVLSGLNQIKPPLRLSFSPYLSGGFRNIPNKNAPVQTETLSSGGMDVKYGINESFTLDATLIPDFGQVMSDNVINNISPFEVQFTENRPFFTEGTELFNKAGIFYSRRIGATPAGYHAVKEAVNGGALSDYRILKNPSVTRLYNAMKFSGRTANNLGIGVFNAVGQPTHATLQPLQGGKDTLLQTEPLTNYNVIVLDQVFKNRSYLTFTNTNVLRQGQEKDANVTALDMAFYDKENNYGLQLNGAYSKIYHGPLSYEGYIANAELGKVSGNFQFSWLTHLVSNQYDPNDLGYLSAPNELSSALSLSYQVFEPKGALLNQRYSIDLEQSYLYTPRLYQRSTIKSNVFLMNRSFWDVSISSEIQPFWFNDYFELQTPQDLKEIPRKKLRKARNYFVGVSGSSDSRKRLFFKYELGFAESPLPNDPFYLGEIGLRYRFSDRFTLDLNYNQREDHGQYGYAFLRDPLTDAPILSRRLYKDATVVLSGTYNFTSRLNLNIRTRHFWNRIENYNFFNVNDDGNWTVRNDYDPSAYNYNYNAFNVDAFLTWDFRLGSRFILGWKNWMGQDFAYDFDPKDHLSYFSNATQVFKSPHGNELTLRFIYFLNYKQFSGR